MMTGAGCCRLGVPRQTARKGREGKAERDGKVRLKQKVLRPYNGGRGTHPLGHSGAWWGGVLQYNKPLRLSTVSSCI